MRNAKGAGTIFYGMHFYPGVAEYAEPDKAPFRVFLNEDTIRAMDPSFAGKPVFVMHVDGVESNVDELRKEADGWVVESFYNSSDGKHWCKFIVVSEKGERAIKNGMRLSNCYAPISYGQGGLWNGVTYEKEIKGGEYEHLAIVPNPRYEESVILTPEEFKKYNADKVLELTRFANEKEPKSMLKLFKRTKVENAIDLAEMCVVLPKSGKEYTLDKLVNEMDEHITNKGYGMAHPDHMVDMGDGTKMTVKDMMGKHTEMKDALACAKQNAEEETQEGEVEVDREDTEESDIANDDEDGEDEKKEKEKDEDMKKKNKKKNDADTAVAAAAAAKAKAKEKADRVRNAKAENFEELELDLGMDQVARGKARYGSGK